MADTAAAPQILPFGVPLSPEESTTTGSSTSAPTPFGATKANPLGVEAAPRAALSQSGQDIATATQRQGAATVGQSQAAEEGARKTASQQTANRLEMEEQARQQQELNDEARARKLDIQDRVKNFKLEDYFDGEGGTARRVLAAISSGLLTFGTGQFHNVALELSDNFHRKQLDKLAHLEKQLEAAGVDERDVRQFGMESRANLAAIHAQRLNAIAAETAAQAARYNTPAAHAAADLATAQAKKAAAEADLQADVGLRGSAAQQKSETKNQNAKAAPPSTEPAEKGAEAQILGTAVDQVSHGFVALPKRSVENAEKAARETLSKTKTTGEGGSEQVQELLGAGSPIEGLRTPGERAHARALVVAATALGKKNNLPPSQALETLMPRADATPEQNGRAIKNLHDTVDAMTPGRVVIGRHKDGTPARGLYVNGKVIVQ